MEQAPVIGCVVCGQPRARGRAKFCSPECAAEHTRIIKAESQRRKNEEEKLDPMCFRTPEQLRRYLKMDVKKPAKYVARSLAECEAITATQPPRTGPTQAMMREQGLIGKHINRSGGGPRTEE